MEVSPTDFLRPGKIDQQMQIDIGYRTQSTSNLFYCSKSSNEYIRYMRFYTYSSVNAFANFLFIKSSHDFSNGNL